MLWYQGYVMLDHIWMQVSIALFVFIQVFDHFWADKTEDKLTLNPEAFHKNLKIWLIINFLYTLTASLLIVT